MDLYLIQTALKLALKYAPPVNYERLYPAIRAALAELETFAAVAPPRAVARVVTVGGYPDDSQHTVEWLVKHKDLSHGQVLYARSPSLDDIRKTVVEEFPLLDETGLSETEHPCEWAIQQERKRLYVILNQFAENPVHAKPVAWRWLYNGKPDSDKCFPMPGPDGDIVAAALDCAHPRTVQYLAEVTPTRDGKQEFTDSDIQRIYDNFGQVKDKPEHGRLA